MPLDRRITVNIQAEGTRDDQGDFIPGPTTSHDVWATRMDRTQSDIEQEGGTLANIRRDYRVRWFANLSDTPANRLSVVEDGITFNVLNIAESTGRRNEYRRRYMLIQAEHTN